MAKTMTIEHNDVKYVLEYTRKSVEMMERQGFEIATERSRQAALGAHRMGLIQAGNRAFRAKRFEKARDVTCATASVEGFAKRLQ